MQLCHGYFPLNTSATCSEHYVKLDYVAEAVFPLDHVGGDEVRGLGLAQRSEDDQQGALQIC